MLFKIVRATALLAAFVSFGVGNANAKTRLTVNCFWAPQHFVCKSILKTWGEQVEKVTEGRVKVSIPPKSVAPPPHQWSSV